MPRTRRITTSLLTIGLGIAAVTGFADDQAARVTDLSGTWQSTSLTGPQGLKAMHLTMTFSGKKMTATGGPGEEDASNFQINSLKTPAEIDWIDRTSNKVTERGIYQISGDKLTIAFGPGDNARPTEFKASESVILIELVRDGSATTQPALTRPALTQPALTQPALTQPAMTQPAAH